jgi:hypothetical protein
MKKQIKVSMTATAALLALAGIAQAAPAELNIYGASAQYLYWNAQAQNYAATILGCTAAAPVADAAGKHGFVSAVNCTSTLVPVNAATGKRDLDIRYSGIASAEGPLAVKKAAPLDATLATGCSIANGERLMYATATTKVCKQVHIGTSDVAGESLNQVSSGQKLGPMGGGAFSVTLSGVSTAGLTPNNTVVVPFGFFINNAVTATKCNAGFIGNYCSTDADCGTTTAGACDTVASTIDNITREQAVLIFSQQTADWSDFGAYFTAQPTVACLRHAGSGTHSALDKTVVNGSWGGTLATTEAVDSIWFNQGASDEIKCINGNSTATSTGSLIGAIGYADADQAVGTAGTSQNVKLIKYNGVYPTRAAIRNGLYDFYTNAWLYTNPANTATVNALAASIVAFAQVPANVPASKANFWAAVGEMKYNRGSDAGYPGYVGASIPQLP